MLFINFIRELFFYTKKTKGRIFLILFFLLFLFNSFSTLFLFKSFIKIIVILLNFIIFLTGIYFYKKIIEENFINFTKYNELEAVIENISNGIIIYDKNFKIIDINTAAQKIFNLTKEEIINKTITPQMINDEKYKILVQTIFPSLAPSINTIADLGWPKIVEIDFDKPYLKLKTILNQVINKKTNEVIAFIKIIQDQTREKNILESKSEFLTVAAHQLRTPITALNWTLESLKNNIKQNETNEEVLSLSEEALNLSKRILKIVEDLLNAAQIEEGKTGFNFEETNLEKIIKEIIEIVSKIAKQKNINIETKIKTKDLNILADKEKIKMAIGNIVDNAIRYNYNGGSVFIAIEDDPQNNENLKISISDTGIGIPQESLKKIFTKFYRAENSQRVEPNGSGLGLYITKNIIENHKGKIFVESYPERGTTFWITLPKSKKIKTIP